MSTFVLKNYEESSNNGFLINAFFLFLPLLTIRGETNNNYITGLYIIFLFLVIVLNKSYFENFNFIIYDYKIWIMLLIWGLYILNKSPMFFLGVKYYIFTILTPFILFQVINNIKLNEKLLRKLFQVLFFVGFVLGIGSVFYIFFEGYDPRARLTSFWTAFNMVSGYLMIIFMFNLSFLINRKKNESITLYSVSILFILFGIFLTQTRGVWVATIMAIALFFLKRPKIIIPAVLFFGIFAYFFPGVILDRFSTVVNFTKDASAVGRMQAWLSSALLIMNNPFLGYGFESYVNLRDSVFSFYVVKVLHSHNTYLRALLELGLVGTILYFFFFFKSIYYVFTFKNNEFVNRYKRYIDGLQMSFLGLLIIFNFEPYFSIYDNSCLVIWLIISISFAMRKIYDVYVSVPNN